MVQAALQSNDEERLPPLGSPDKADALALTFAEIIAPGRVEDSFEPDDW